MHPLSGRDSATSIVIRRVATLVPHRLREATWFFRSDEWLMVYVPTATTGNRGDDSEDAIRVEGIQAWFDLCRHSIATDPRAWNNVSVTP